MTGADTRRLLHLGLVKLDDLEPCRQKMYRVYLASPLTGVPKSRQRMTTVCRDLIKVEFRSTKHGAFDVYDPSEFTPPGSRHTSDEVYKLDREGVTVSDLLVICRTSPSDGCGMEHGFAVAANIPILLVYPEGDPVSRLTLAQPGEQLQPLCFRSSKDLRKVLAGRMKDIASLLITSRATRLHRIQSFEETRRAASEVARSTCCRDGTTAAMEVNVCD